MKIMVHTCCAPCGTYVFKRLGEEGHRLKALYFNPNIHPDVEHERRRETLETYVRRIGLEVTFEDYEPQAYWDAIGTERNRPARCERCYRLRLERTAEAARDSGCDAYTTTLLISPYQDHDRLAAIGHEVAAAKGIPFHYEDYRTGYRESRNLAKEAGLYRQRYCGCIFSVEERG